MKSFEEYKNVQLNEDMSSFIGKTLSELEQIDRDWQHVVLHRNTQSPMANGFLKEFRIGVRRLITLMGDLEKSI
jgi:hypothetical protein